MDGGLIVNPDLGIIQRKTLCDQNLRTDQVNTRNLFRDGVFHLNTGIHLNEINGLVLVDQELYSTGIVVINTLAYADGIIINFLQCSRNDGQ